MTEDGSDVRFWGESGHASGPAERRQMTHSGPAPNSRAKLTSNVTVARSIP
jgi:hypothetical protein